MNVFWIGLVGGQARSLWGTILLSRGYSSCFFEENEGNCSSERRA